MARAKGWRDRASTKRPGSAALAWPVARRLQRSGPRSGVRNNWHTKHIESERVHRLEARPARTQCADREANLNPETTQPTN
eukprot:1978206-Rhodomonas_salina.3